MVGVDPSSPGFVVSAVKRLIGREFELTRDYAAVFGEPSGDFRRRKHRTRLRFPSSPK
jgi:hypothetical protein